MTVDIESETNNIGSWALEEPSTVNIDRIIAPPKRIKNTSERMPEIVNLPFVIFVLLSEVSIPIAAKKL